MRFLLSGIFLLVWVNLWAQQDYAKLRGYVYSEQNTPLVGAMVYFDVGTNAVITDNRGAFEIPLPHQAQYIFAAFVGYTTDSIKIGSQTNYSFRLHAGVDIEAVVVSHRHSGTISSTLEPIRTLIVTETELQKAACCNLSESFETTPSVDVTFTDAVSGARQIQMLGLSGSYVQISRENMPHIRGLASVYGLAFIPGTWISSINLNKGTGSVVNGYESITGQIDVQLREPTHHMDDIYVNVYANEAGRLEMNVNTKHKISDSWSSALLLHGATQRERHDTNHDGFMDMPVGDQIIALNRWGMHNDTMHVEFGVKGTYYTRTGGQMEYDPQLPHASYTPWGMHTQIMRADAWSKIGKVYHHKPWNSIGFQTSGAYHSQDSRYGLRLYSGNQTSGYANFIVEGNVLSHAHMYKTGLSFLYDSYDEQFDVYDFERTEIVPGVFWEYTFMPHSHFTLVAGLRGDYHSHFGMFATPRIHVRYCLNDVYTFRIAAGRGQRTANIFSENNRLFASSRDIIISGNGSSYGYGLDPEVAWNYGFSVLHNFTAYSRKGSFAIDVYRTQFQNQVIVDILQDQHAAVFYNLEGESFSNSFQAQLDYELLPRLDMRVAYRWFDVQTTYEQQGLQKVPFVSEHRAFINLAYRMASDWAFDYTLNWHGEKPLTSITIPEGNPDVYTETSPAFFTMNAQISKSVTSAFDMYIGVENLLGFVQENPIVQASQPYSKDFDSSLIWGPIYGREVYVGLRYRL